MWGSFHNRSGVIVSWENVWTNNYVQMYEFLQQDNLFLSQDEIQLKSKRLKFLLHSMIFFTKFE